MATVQDLQTAVEAQGTVIGSAITLLQGLAQMVRDLKPNQAAIDDLANKISSQAQNLADAVVANTTP